MAYLQWLWVEGDELPDIKRYLEMRSKVNYDQLLDSIDQSWPDARG